MIGTTGQGEQQAASTTCPTGSPKLQMSTGDRCENSGIPVLYRSTPKCQGSLKKISRLQLRLDGISGISTKLGIEAVFRKYIGQPVL